MKKLTDHDMLIAARRALFQHLSTRPATETEQQEIVVTHEENAAAWDREAEKVYQPRTAAEIGRGGGALNGQHKEGIAVAESLQRASHARRFAELCRMRSEAWSSAPATELWEQTRIALQERVDYYAQLCGE